jgi:hypothetical protein
VTRRDGTPAKALWIGRPISLGPIFAAVLFLAGCAAPGQPKPPAPVVPGPVTDLAARQTGPGVTLSFTVPDKAGDGEPLSSPPSIEIFRGFVPSGVKTPEPRAAAQVYLLPGAVVETYLTGGKVRFVDPLAPAELARHAGRQAFYFVRAFVSKKHPSAGSNLALITLEAPPPPVEKLAAGVARDAVVLDWQPLPAGAVTVPVGYHVYRALVREGSGAIAAGSLSPEQLETPLELLAATPLPAYRDTQFAFGRTYLYLVRSVAAYESGPVESADSTRLFLTPRDTFPPAPPGGLVAILAPGTGGLPQAELSWNSSPETDLAGYNVYRSEQSGARGERLNRHLLLVPAFRDSTAVPGRRYDYSVTAVDRAGNESAPSEAVSLSIPGRQDETKP